jgi:hypothetical protein
MPIDITKRIDEKIRKLEQLREFAADPEMRDLLTELVASNGNGNGNGASHTAAKKKGPKGTLSEMVRKACLDTPGGKFTVPDLVARLHDMGYRFEAKDEAVAVYSSLNRLKDKGIVAVAEQGGPAKPAQWIVTAGQKHMKLDT